MYLDKSLFGLEFAEAFKIIREQTKDDLRPVIIVRNDDSAKLHSMRKHLKSDGNCIYIKLGVASSMDKIYELIYQKINGDPNYFGEEFDQLVPVLVARIKAMPANLLIVIDNCQYFVFSQIFPLLGLMLELSGIAQFIFLLPEDYVSTWNKSRPIYNTSLFLKYIQLKYDISEDAIVAF